MGGRVVRGPANRPRDNKQPPKKIGLKKKL